MSVTTYEAKRICPRCPRKQVVRVTFATAQPWDISYQCVSCGHRWQITAPVPVMQRSAP